MARLGLTAGEALDLNGAACDLVQFAAGLHGRGASRRLQVGHEGAFLGGVALPAALHGCKAASRPRLKARRSRQTAASRREQSISASRRSPPACRAQTTATAPMQARGVSALSRKQPATAARSASVTATSSVDCALAAGVPARMTAHAAMKRKRLHLIYMILASAVLGSSRGRDLSLCVRPRSALAFRRSADTGRGGARPSQSHA